MSLRIICVGVALLVANACGTRSTNSTDSSPALATISGQPLSQSLFDHYAKAKSGTTPDKLDPKLKASLLEDLKRLEAAAIQGAAHVTPDTTNDIELSRLNILAHAAAQSAGIFSAPTDAELHQSYDRFVTSLPASEYHVAHILVATENAANLLLVKLQSGADFAKLARTESADDSKSRGGDLGWIAPGKLPAAFTDAVKALKIGKVTLKPVHTPYGWHLIKLLETRAAAAPPFDQVKAQLAANLQQERYQKFLNDSLIAMGEH